MVYVFDGKDGCDGNHTDDKSLAEDDCKILNFKEVDDDDAFIYHNDHAHAVFQGDDCSEMMARIVIDEKVVI